MAGAAARQEVGDRLWVVDVVEDQQPATVPFKPTTDGPQHQFLARAPAQPEVGKRRLVGKGGKI